VPDWDREKISSGTAYVRPLAGRGRPGLQLLNPPEQRKEWRQANHEWPYGNHHIRGSTSGASHLTDHRADARPTEVVQQQQQAQHNQPENSATTQKVKKPRPPFCFRCKCSGHSADECTVMLDCVVCNKKESHLSKKCPPTEMAKPHMTLSGTRANDFNFLQLPEFDFKLEAPNPEPTALVTITGGKLSPQVL
jgi:hypothetical protein